MKETKIKTESDWSLTGIWFTPKSEPDNVIVISGATGVPSLFYRHFAQWCKTEHNAACLIYDYRDFGSSQVNSVRKSKVCMSDWGILDQRAAIKHALEKYPDHKITIIGHSLGGMFLQYHSDSFPGKIKQAVTVASGAAHWLSHPLHFIPFVTVFWWLLGPAITSLLGYMPSKSLGFGANLQSGAYWQWRRWCVSKCFYRVDWETHLAEKDFPAQLDFPVTMLAINDDPMMSMKAVLGLREFYQAKSLTVKNIIPSNFGLKKIGHIHLFARGNKKTWPEILPK